jgi:hypothetical protein
MLGTFFAAMLLVAFLGSRAAPDANLSDLRASTYLTGPSGVAALAQTLELLGVEVERRRIPLFGVADDLAPRGPGTALAVVEPAFGMTAEESRHLKDYVRRGGTLVLVGWTDVTEQFGLTQRSVSGLLDDQDTAAVTPPDGIGEIPGTWSVLARRRVRRGELPPLLPHRTDTLVSTFNRRPVALRLEFAGRGRALVIAEVDWLRNRALRDTDVGALVIPWLLALGIDRLVVDEYHHGFGRSGALVGAVWGWLVGGPPGWAMLQLAFAGLVALAALAVRFGPALHVIPRRRRSPVEHLEALASGLDRAGGGRAATDLLGRGLARRLRRAGRDAPRTAWNRDRERWLATLARSNDNPATRAAVKRLGWLLRERGEDDEHVLRTAQAVEDVWEALKRPSGRTPS